jgi:uncharacterized membrane protein YwzB
MSVIFTCLGYYFFTSIAIQYIIKKGKALQMQRLPFFLIEYLL